AIFEPEHAEFRKRAVTHFEPRALYARQWDVFLTGLLIDPDRMTLAERAAAAVLAGQADAMAVGKQAAEGNRLCGGPVEAFAAGKHLLLRVEDALQRLVNVEAFGNAG